MMRDRRKTLLELRRNTVLFPENTLIFYIEQGWFPALFNIKNKSVVQNEAQLVVILPRKARTSNTKRLPVPETDTGR